MSVRAASATLTAMLALGTTGGVAWGEGPGGWSAPVQLSGCAGAVAPRVAFPSRSPAAATGPGAIVWAEDPGCAAAGAGARLELSVAALRPDERATLSGRQAPADWPHPALAAVGASLGRIAVAAPLERSGPGATAVFQGRATRPLSSRTLLGGTGSPLSLARAYLGDVGVATVSPDGAIEVRVQRYFRSRFAAAVRIPLGPGRVSALTATMDYRSDVLVAWQQNGAIYAHMLRASGRPEPTQLVGRSAANPQLQALVSDNDHGMIAWAGGENGGTAVRLALSGAGVRFLPSRVVASYGDPRGIGSAPGSLALMRLSTENVMLAWTAAEHGHYLVRAVPAVFAGVRPSTRLSDPAGQAVLADLAPGPAGEAVALWRQAPGSGLDLSRAGLWAARAYIRRGGRVGSHAPERVAGAAGEAAPSVAVDPASDRPVVAWLTPGAHPRVWYATGPAAPGYRARRAGTAIAVPHAGTHWLRISLAALGGAAILAFMALARRRAASRRAGGGSRGRGPRR